MTRRPIIKVILSAVAVAVFGFVLLDLTFLFVALVESVITGIVGLLMVLGPDAHLPWFPLMRHGVSVVLIGLISWLLLRSRMRVLSKAIVLSVPVATVLVTVGMFLNRWPSVSYAVGATVTVAALLFLRTTKQPWLYTFTVAFWSIVLFMFTLLGGEI